MYIISLIKYRIRSIILCITPLWLAACQSFSISTPDQYVELPDKLAQLQENLKQTHQQVPSWSAFVKDDTLQTFITKALTSNGELQQIRLNTDIAAESLNSQKREIYWPDLFLEFEGRRIGGDNIETENTFELGAQLSYELNIWGQLSDANRLAAYNYAVAQADFMEAKQDIVFFVITSWYDALAQIQLEQLFEKRVKNQRENLQSIESRYKAGLTSALDVYLARNDVEQEKSNLSQQSITTLEAKRALQVLVQEYPNADEISELLNQFSPRAKKGELLNGIDINDFFDAILPAKMLARSPQLQSSWLSLLAQNAQLAISHKARFPSFSIDLNVNQRSDRLSQLIDAGQFSWSIGASILQPLLNSGDLLEAENINRLELKQAETSYIDTVYEVFEVIENALDNRQALKEQWDFTLSAARNASFAEELAHNQYEKGLIEYTTVLESQRRNFDAQASLITLRQAIQTNTALLLREFVADIDI